jgi:hypothetical protein
VHCKCGARRRWWSSETRRPEKLWWMSLSSTFQVQKFMERIESLDSSPLSKRRSEAFWAFIEVATIAFLLREWYWFEEL